MKGHPFRQLMLLVFLSHGGVLLSATIQKKEKIMEISNIPVGELKPYDKNAKLHDRRQTDNVAESIRQFGFKQPIVIDRKNVVVIGHCRLEAAKQLGLVEVPCVVADDLTDEQIKALRIVDNKTNESPWDMELVASELEEIDLSGFGFDFDTEEIEEDDEDEEEGYYGDERERTFNSTNLHDVDLRRTAGRWQIPIIKATHHIPQDLISFNYVLSKDDFDKGVHFYIDDYQFERIWNNPHEYMDRLRQFDCCLTPDFSMYLEMPMAMQLWNVYRSRMIGQIMQDNGITVIPTLMWSTPESYDFCFDGIEPGGVVSVSTIGVKTDDDCRDYFMRGMDEAMKRLKPSHVVVYGGDIGYEFTCGVTYIENHNAKRLETAGGGGV